MKYTNFIILLLAIFATSCQPHAGQNQINLAGSWQYELDPDDKGIQEEWYNRNFEGSLTLPGSLTTNNIGDDISVNTPWTGLIVDSSYFKSPEYAKYREPGNIKVPCWLQPIKYYKGAAWYQKEVSIPESWKGQAIELYLERCHWESRVWVDGQEAGMQNSLGTAHQYDLTSMLTPGKHRLTVCIDNRTKAVDPGLNSHSISDHTQSNWNGMIGDLLLKAEAPIHIKNLQAFPDLGTKSFTVKATVVNTGSVTQKGNFSLNVQPHNFKSNEDIPTVNQQSELLPGENQVELSCQLGESAALWDEFNPNLYELDLQLQTEGTQSGKQIVTGLREFETAGTRFAINGRPTFLRGTLECAIFPKTGYPPCDTTEWKRIMRIVKAHGLNHIRFHSWCPPEAAFTAADELGVYLQVECSSWANTTTTIGDGKPIDAYLWDESKRMVEAYGNHPSFCLMAYGNEPAGKNQREFLSDFVNYWTEKDSRRLYTGAAAWPVIEANNYHNIPAPRIQGWGEGLQSIINSQPPRSDYDWRDDLTTDGKPVVSHEIGQWCAYPNFKEIEKYDGVLKAKNFEIFQEKLEEQSMIHLADSFLLASGKLQALCYKADIEAALRTPGFAGFQLLDLHDFPGQGTALVGVLDAFWDEKGYITPEEYSQFCNSIVPLARLKKHVFTVGDTLQASVEVANFSSEALNQAKSGWTLKTTDGTTVAQGIFKQQDVPIGNCFKLGQLNYVFKTSDSPKQLRLEVSIDSAINHWDLWVYPAKKTATPSEILVTRQLNRQAIDQLNNGGKVLLNLGKGTVKEGYGGEVGLGFSSIFWNTAWTVGQKPHTLGILCNPSHPALSQFPTEYHSNWQWWDAVSHADAINISQLNADIEPIVRIIDDWVTNRPLALLFEVTVGNGKLLVSSADLTTNLQERPAAQQLRTSLEQYMLSEQFNPEQSSSIKQLKNLLR